MEDQDSMEYKTVKVARQWDIKEVESFCCYEVNYRVLREALSTSLWGM